MKITSVELHPVGSSEVCVLSFRDPKRQNPYNVKAMLGLDAEELVPRFYGVSGGIWEGSKFYNLSLRSREIVAKIELNPNFGVNISYSSLRDQLYRIISSSRTGMIEIQFKDGLTIVAVLFGFVTKMEAPHATKVPEVTITVKCDDPMLRSPTSTIVSVVGRNAASTIINDPYSNAPHGFAFEMSVLATLNAYIIQQNPSDFSLTPFGGFLAGDLIQISSEYNNKYARMVRGGVITNLEDSIYPNSQWPLLFPGDNTFTITNFPATLAWTAISYYPTYWGV